VRFPGSELAKAREARGIKQKDLARLLGITPTSLSSVENGWVAPWPRLRREAARILGCTEDDLFGSGEPPPVERGV
jgi:transcriptional regulator with XRE-family HTH domain